MFDKFCSRVKNSRTGEESTMNCQLLIYSIGYETLVLEGLPKNEKVCLFNEFNDFILPFNL